MNVSDSAFDADLIILGGGCAGLSLASRLAARCASLSVIVIEPRSEYVEDRTWCGWRTSPHPYTSCVAATWSAWRVIGKERTVERGSSTVPYEMIPAHRFYDQSLNVIRASTSARVLMNSRADAIKEEAEGVSIRLTDGRTLHSRWVVDTRPQKVTYQYPSLWQNFVGYEISANPAWTEHLGTTPVLMDFQPSGSSAVQFMYVLPLESDRFLCEWTSFSAIHGQTEAIERDLNLWLEQRGYTPRMIGRRESGSLPMAVAPLPVPAGSRIVRAGTSGGSMRASTGYAFHAIQRWADHCTASLAAGGPPLPPQRSAMLDFLDEVFLAALQDHPLRGQHIFVDLFERTDPNRLIRFLSGIPRRSDLLPVMASLPWLQFSAAAFKILARKLVRG